MTRRTDEWYTNAGYSFQLAGLLPGTYEIQVWVHEYVTNGWRWCAWSASSGKPIENAYIESFNGKFRDECLNEHWFQTVTEAQRLIEAWRQNYNDVRPHSALGNVPPAVFAAATAPCPEVLIPAMMSL